MAENLLKIENLTVHYVVDKTTVEAVTDLSLELGKGECIGLVGETGAGKTTTALSIMGLVPNPPGKVISGKILYEGDDLLEMNEKQIRKIRGEKISMIFQDPMTSLNPVMRVGDQIAESIRLHTNLSKAEVVVRASHMLEMVGIPATRYDEFPHQFSGGMKQRVMIACALACNPELLIADEPTTALDVTIQAQVLDLIRNLRKELNMSLLMITHDLGVVFELCDKVAVMYAGSIVEKGDVLSVFKNPSHPYTIGLLNSLPDLEKDTDRLEPIAGLMPDPSNLPEGCAFGPRCPYCTERCKGERPVFTEVEPGHFVSCFAPAGGKQ